MAHNHRARPHARKNVRRIRAPERNLRVVRVDAAEGEGVVEGGERAQHRVREEGAAGAVEAVEGEGGEVGVGVWNDI